MGMFGRTWKLYFSSHTQWDKDSLEVSLNEWFSRLKLKPHIVVHFLVLWGIWIARNTLVLEDKVAPTFQVAT